MKKNKYGGVNDLPKEFTKTELGKKVYSLWYGMLKRCYDTKQQKRQRGASYIDVSVCDRWFSALNFYKDIQKLDGYEKWSNTNLMCLDKDIKAQNDVKIYSPQTCTFITRTESIKEKNERNNFMEKAHHSVKTTYILFKGDEHHIFETEKSACDFLGITNSCVSSAWRRNKKCSVLFLLVNLC